MSKESAQWLAENVLVGYGRQAWHFNAELGSGAQHYDGAIPMERVLSLFDSADPIAVPAFAQMPDGSMVPIAGKQAIARRDGTAVYGVMSDSYTIHRHRELVNGMAHILTDDAGNHGALGISSAGLLDAGAVAWVSASLADTATTAAGVDFVTYLLAYGSHNGRHATSWKLVNQLVVCDNTLEIATGESTTRFAVKHTSNSLNRIGGAREALGLILAGQDDFAREVEALCSVEVTDADFWRIVDQLAPAPADDATGRGATMAQNKRDAVVSLYRSDPRVAPWAGTAFGVLQAYNTYSHWQAPGTGTGVVQARNMTRNLTGQAAEADALALSVIRGILAGV